MIVVIPPQIISINFLPFLNSFCGGSTQSCCCMLPAQTDESPSHMVHAVDHPAAVVAHANRQFPFGHVEDCTTAHTADRGIEGAYETKKRRPALAGFLVPMNRGLGNRSSLAAAAVVLLEVRRYSTFAVRAGQYKCGGVIFGSVGFCVFGASRQAHAYKF